MIDYVLHNNKLAKKHRTELAQRLWCLIRSISIDYQTDDNEDIGQGDLVSVQELEFYVIWKTVKQPHQSGVDAKLIKYGVLIFKLRLLHLFNCLWQERRVLNDWKNDVVVSLFKKGSRRDYNNYRGINIIDTAHKAYTMIMNRRLVTNYKQKMQK